jgi:hypothetical protein
MEWIDFGSSLRPCIQKVMERCNLLLSKHRRNDMLSLAELMPEEILCDSI